MATAFAIAQTSGGTGSGGSKGAPPSGGNTPTPPVVTQPRNIPPIQQPNTGDQQRVMFLTGRVVYDDGTAAGSQVSIERVCNGRARREAYTDAGGHFSISLGRETTMVQDASVGGDGGFGTFGQPGRGTSADSIMGGVSERDLMNCELRASAPGAWSDVLMLAGRRSMDDPNVGTIVLHRMGKVEGTRVSVSSMQAPKDAKKAFEHGQKAVAKQKWPEAQQDFEKAVGAYPRYADAWVELGAVYARLNRPQDARKAFEQALSIDPKFMAPYFHLAVMAANEQNWKQVADLTDKALALDAYEYPAAYFYNALAYFELHKLDQAEKSARTARRLDSQYKIPKIDLVLSSVLLQRGDLAGAAQQLREFLKRSPTGDDAERARAVLNDAEQKIASQRQ